jgi:hypothetical protein
LSTLSDHWLMKRVVWRATSPPNRGGWFAKAVFEVSRDLPGVVHDLRAVDDDGHEVLSAEPLDGVDIGEADGAIFDVYALVGKGVADAP